jgi:lipopolysaccharide transport system permease protein
MTTSFDGPGERALRTRATRRRSETPTLVIRPAARRTVSPAEVWAHRDLLLMLAGRDVKVRYRQTLLGASWVVLPPVLVSGVFTFVFGRVANLQSDATPYFVFAFAGLLCWNLFSNLLLRISGSLLQNTALVSKVYFPRLVLPLGAVLSSMVDLVVAFGVMVILLFANHVTPRWHVVTLPVWILLTIVLATGVGLVAAGLIVRYRDVQYVTPLLLQLLLYASPVAYSTNAIPHRYRALFAVNPLVGLLDGYRWALLRHSPLHKGYAVYSVVAAVAMLALGLWVFRRAERTFADVI